MQCAVYHRVIRNPCALNGFVGPVARIIYDHRPAWAVLEYTNAICVVLLARHLHIAPGSPSARGRGMADKTLDAPDSLVFNQRIETNPDGAKSSVS